MEFMFLKIVNMSISAVWIVLAVVLMRLMLKKAPKAMCVALWAIVALRLVVPFSFESVFSLIPSAETIPESVVNEPFTGINSGFEVIDNRVNEYFTENNTNDTVSDVVDIPEAPAQNEKSAVGTLSFVWLGGVALMAVYFAVSYTALYRRVRASVNIGNNVYVCDDIATPFILGVIKPRIYVQSKLGDEQLEHILAHENAHIKRLDHWWKPIGFAILAVHWFNPAIWLAYVLLCRDIEYACDEKVIKDMDGDFVKSYSETLLSCSVSSKRITACPVAFGEVSVKERIKTVLNYKRPAFWIIIAAILACVVTAAVFLTNPLADKNENGESGVDLLGNKWFEAIVLEVSSESVLVKPCEGTEELRCSDKITFKVLNNDYSALKAGQKIRIFYDSVIQETYPARLPNVKKVEIVGDVMPNALVGDIKTAFTGMFPDRSFSLYTEAVNASLIDDGHSPVHVFTEYEKFESFLKQYRGHWYGETDADSTLGLLESYDSDYFIDKAVVLVYTEETFQFANTVSKVTKNDSVIIIDFSPMYIDSHITGYRCKFHAIGIDKDELIGVDTFQAKAAKPNTSEEDDEYGDSNVYDVSFYGYTAEAAYFIDYTSPLYKYALNYTEVIDKSVYAAPIHKFKSYSEMESFFEPYTDTELGEMAYGTEKLLKEGKSVFNKYDTVYVAFVLSYNSDINFSASTLKKQGDKLFFGISSNGPEAISDSMSGSFVLYGVKGSNIEGCTEYSATVTDREFYVVPKVETEAFKINKDFGLDDDIYTNALNAPFDTLSNMYEMPLYIFTSQKELKTVFGDTERLEGEKNWTAEYDDGFFESKSLVVCYFTAPSGTHTYGVSDRTGNILRSELNGAFLYMVAERTDAPGEEETDDLQGWIVVLETDKAHLDREMIIIDAYVEYENTKKQ